MRAAERGEALLVTTIGVPLGAFAAITYATAPEASSWIERLGVLGVLAYIMVYEMRNLSRKIDKMADSNMAVAKSMEHAVREMRESK